MRIADTLVLYAFFSRNDVHHIKVVNEVKNLETILTPTEIW